MRDKFAARLVQTKLATIDDISDFVKQTNFDNKLKNFKKLLQIKKNMYWLKMNKVSYQKELN